MNLLLTRFATGLESTLGVLHRTYDTQIPKRFRCFTLEDQPNEPKIPGETRIPAGYYRIKLREDSPMARRYANRFPWHRGMLWLQNVPDFTYVYIHVGNDDDDTEGCILVGDGAQSNRDEDGMVTSSVRAYRRLYREVINAINVGEPVWLKIEDLEERIEGQREDCL